MTNLSREPSRNLAGGKSALNLLKRALVLVLKCISLFGGGAGGHAGPEVMAFSCLR